MGCTNSKERPRTPPPDAALQSAVSDGDGFWAANGEKRASREATPLKAAADPFQTVDLTNPETAAAAASPSETLLQGLRDSPYLKQMAQIDNMDLQKLMTGGDLNLEAAQRAAAPAEIPAAVAADAFGAPPTPVLKQDIKQAMPPQADADPKVPAPATTTAEAPAPAAEAPSATAATTEASAPKPSPTKPPAIKPDMPGGRKKSNKKKKGKKGKSKK